MYTAKKLEKSQLLAGLHTGKILDFTFDSESNNPKVTISVVTSPCCSKDLNYIGCCFETNLDNDEKFQKFIETFSWKKKTTEISKLVGIFIDFTVQPRFENGQIENRIVGVEYSYDLNESAIDRLGEEY